MVTEREDGAAGVAVETQYAQRLAGARTRQAAMQLAVDEVCQRVGCEVAWTGTVDGEHLVMGAYHGIRSSEMALTWRLRLGHGIGGRVALDGLPAASRDYRHDSRRVPLMTRVLDEEGIRSLMSVPLLAGDRVLGVFYAARRVMHDWSAAELTAVTGMGRDLAVRMTMLEQEEAVTERLRRAESDVAGLREAVRRLVHLAERFTEGEDVRAGVELLALETSMTVELRHADGWLVHRAVEAATPQATVRWQGAVGPRGSHILAVVGEHDLDAAGVATATAVAALTTLQMARAQERSAEEMRLASRFFDAVLSGDGRDLGPFVAEASLLGLDLRRPACLALVGRRGDDLVQRGLTPHDVSAATAVVAAQFPGSVVTPRDGDLLAVVLTDVGAEEVGRVLRRHVLPALGAARTWVAGVGTRCADVIDYAVSYREARRALAFCRSVAGAATGSGGRGGRSASSVAVAGDLGSWSPLDGAAGSGGRQVAEALGPLLDSDERHGTTHVETLHHYVREDRHLARTAAALHVHPNTVRYRIARIEELLGATLRDVDTRFRVESALRLRAAARGDLGPR